MMLRLSPELELCGGELGTVGFQVLDVKDGRVCDGDHWRELMEIGVPLMFLFPLLTMHRDEEGGGAKAKFISLLFQVSFYTVLVIFLSKPVITEELLRNN